jgi:2,3-dihydroxybenzoate decarboxylase
MVELIEAPELEGKKTVKKIILEEHFLAFPKMTLVLGHLGEMLPYVLVRLDDSWKRSAHSRELKKLPSQYIKENMMITTSGHFSNESLLCALLTVGADRLLFSVDYPYQSIKDGAQFIETAPISDADREKICYRNAEQLLSL